VRLRALLTVMMVLVSALSVSPGYGQARIEVASIKAAKPPNDPRGLTCALPYFERTGGRMYTPFAQACGLIRMAYDLADYQVVGIPRDTGVGPTQFFEIDVRLSGGDVPSMDVAREVIRGLLAERFKLRTHSESREAPIYVLIPTAGGPRLAPCSNPKASSGYAPGRIISCNPPLPMPRLLQFLSSEAGRPVVDRTGLAAQTFELRWLPAQAEPSADSPPGLFTAIQEQLGLKLEPATGPLHTLLVDAIEAPDPN
jgi:uncharacterized protein (TIGR03435 family)